MSSLPKKPNPAANAYKKTGVMTANREAILLMLYEGAIRFLRGAMEASKKGDRPERTRLIGRALDIVNELRATLDHKVGGEIAEHLESLYVFVSNRLLLSSSEETDKNIEESLNVLETLYQGWSQAISQIKKGSEISKP